MYIEMSMYIYIYTHAYKCVFDCVHKPVLVLVNALFIEQSF